MVRPADEVKKEIVKRYNAEPEDWQIHLGKSPDRYITMIATHGSDKWIVKEQPLSPFESIGFGTQQTIKEGEEALRTSRYTFGFRPLTANQAKTLVTAMEEERDLDELLGKVLRTKPVPIDQINSPAAIQGPIIHSSNPLQLLSEEQRELDRKLAAELEKHLINKYFYRTGMYL